MVRKLHEVKPAGWGETPPGLGAPLLRVLEARVGRPTIVKMADGAELMVMDGSWWGRDFGHVWDHVTAKLTPDSTLEWAWFMLSDVEALLEPDGRRELIRQVPAPGETRNHSDRYGSAARMSAPPETRPSAWTALLFQDRTLRARAVGGE